MILPNFSSSQTFVDPVNLSTIYRATTYRDSLATKNTTRASVLGLLFPKTFKNGNVLIIRLNSEMVHSEAIGQSSTHTADLYSFALPVGCQLLSKNKKWNALILGIPKLSSDLNDDMSKDLQFGGSVLFSRIKSEQLKIKFGVYYNREFFGNVIIPLLGIDWNPTPHFFMYGTLPNNFRFEIKWNERIYSGFGIRFFQRSYRLSAANNNNYVRTRENLLKLYTDVFIFKKLLFFAEAAYGINYSFLEYSDSEQPGPVDPVYTPVQNGFLVNVGIALRIRKDYDHWIKYNDDK